MLACFICGCFGGAGPQSSSTSSIRDTSPPETTTTITDEGYIVHEWGVLAGCPEDNLSFVTAIPKQVMLAKQPVIYIHSKTQKPFNISFTFKNGTPTETHPPADVKGGRVSWSNVRAYDACPPERLAKAAHIPMPQIIPALRRVNASCLSVGDSSEKFLYFEGELEYENKIMVEYDRTTQKAKFANEGRFGVENLMLVLSNGGNYMQPNIFIARAENLNPGETKDVDFVPFKPNQFPLTKDLLNLGFTPQEAESFADLWYLSFFMPTNTRQYANLIYRIPQVEYERMIQMDARPAPIEAVRVLYVLISLP